MKYRMFVVLALLACTFAVQAGTRAAVRKTVENSMLVTGHIAIAPDGSVSSHTLDQAEKIPQVVRDLVAKAVPVLRFEPVVVDAKAVKARATMSVRVAAIQQDNGNYRLRIASASFGESETGPSSALITKNMAPPRYPEAAYMANITGTVYLLLKVGTQGTVEDVATEQVNLTVLGNARQMEQGRKLLSQASMSAAKRWQFSPPARDALGDEAFLVVRVPVDFRFHDQSKPGYGQWETYVPGPRETRPGWLHAEDAEHNPDAMIAGGIYPVGSGLKLRGALPSG